MTENSTETVKINNKNDKQNESPMKLDICNKKQENFTTKDVNGQLLKDNIPPDNKDNMKTNEKQTHAHKRNREFENITQNDFDHPFEQTNTFN